MTNEEIGAELMALWEKPPEQKVKVVRQRMTPQEQWLRKNPAPEIPVKPERETPAVQRYWRQRYRQWEISTAIWVRRRERSGLFG